MDDFVRKPLRFASMQQFDIHAPELFRNYFAGSLITYGEGLIFGWFRVYTGMDFAATGPAVLPIHRELRRPLFRWTDQSVMLKPECIDEVVVMHQSRVAQNLFPIAVEKSA